MKAELVESIPNKRRPRLDIGRAFKLRLGGMSYEEIGAALGGYAKSHICEALQDFRALLDNPESIKTFREHEADLLTGVRAKLVRLIADRSSSKKLSAYQLTGMYGILFDKTRLLEGKSTENISNLTAIIQAVHNHKHELPANEGRDPNTGQVAPTEEPEFVEHELKAEKMGDNDSHNSDLLPPSQQDQVLGEVASDKE